MKAGTQVERLYRFICYFCPREFINAQHRGIHEYRDHAEPVPVEVRADRARHADAVRRRRFRQVRPTYYRDRYAVKKSDPAFVANIRAHSRADIAAGANAARKAVGYALQTGRLVKGPCQECGEAKVEAHHFAGYLPPHQLDVVWLCKAHHEAAHHEDAA